MTAALAAIRKEAAATRLHLSALETAEQALARVLETTAPEPEVAAAAPRRTRRAATPRRNRNQQALEPIREFVVANAPVTLGQVVAEFGGPSKSMSRRLRRLIDRGEITADGNSSARRFRAPATPRKAGSAAAPAPTP